MFKTAFSVATMILLLFGVFLLRFNIQPVQADSQTVYIRADGSIDPSAAPVSTADNVTYTFTGNMSYPTYNGIIIERNNTIIDGMGFTVKGMETGTSEGISFTGKSNVTIENVMITGFDCGIYLNSSLNNSISDDNVVSNMVGIWLDYCDGNSIYENNVANSPVEAISLVASSSNTIRWNNVTTNQNGIALYGSSSNIIDGNNATANHSGGIALEYLSNNNTVSKNNAAANGIGIYLSFSKNNIVKENNMTANSRGGILFGQSNFGSSSGNGIYHNDFIGNAVQASVDSASVGNAWDNGYPNGGNYWSNYDGSDVFIGPDQNVPGSDGIGDAPYIIDTNNTDHYPLTNPYGSSLSTCNLTILGTQGGTVNLPFGTYPIINGSPVNVTANSNPICHFDHWQLDNTSESYSNSYSLVMNTNHTLEAFFFLFDMNNDGSVNMKDIAIAAAAFGSTPNSPKWNPISDVNHDGKVDIKDIALIAGDFGHHYP